MSLNDFTVLSKVGEGAYSTVHKVRRNSDNTIYALKKVQLKGLKDKQKQNALNEVRLLASIDCDSIIAYKQAFFDQGSNTLCIVLEFADGGDLQKVINQRKKMLQWIPQAQIWKILEQVTAGLDQLHKKNIIHRDIKPANIFIQQGSYKIADLNVSKLLKHSLAQTQTGTPYYASPQVWSDQPYEMKSDIWSLGCILYETCALKPPFMAQSLDGLYKKVRKGQYPRIPSIYSSRLQRIIAGCLQIDPKKRFSCEDIIRQLQLPQKNSKINMLSTIRVPKNAQSWREELPKAKYDTDKDPQQKIVLGSKVSYISQHKLREIVRQKMQQVQLQRQNRSISEAQNHSSSHNPSYLIAQAKSKRHQQIDPLPRLKLHSQPVQYHVDDRQRYDHNRPSWWG